jgi:hypothetical protein
LYLKGSDKEQLKMLGYQEGDPVPAHLAEAVAEISARMNEEIKAQMAAAGGNTATQVEAKKIYKIDEMPAKYQAELKQLLDQAKHDFAVNEAQAAREAREQKLTRNLAPSVADAVRRQSGQPSALEEQVANAGPGPVMVDDDAVLRGETTTPEPVTPETTGDAGGVAPVKICPRCFYDLTQSFDVPVTDEDRTQYTAVILSPSPVPAHQSLNRNLVFIAAARHVSDLSGSAAVAPNERLLAKSWLETQS